MRKDEEVVWLPQSILDILQGGGYCPDLSVTVSECTRYRLLKLDIYYIM